MITGTLEATMLDKDALDADVVLSDELIHEENGDADATAAALVITGTLEATLLDKDAQTADVVLSETLKLEEIGDADATAATLEEIEQLEKEYDECRKLEDELHAAARLRDCWPTTKQFAYRRENQHKMHFLDTRLHELRGSVQEEPMARKKRGRKKR